ncbi:polysaccharide biosynthesis protein [Bifidobacterium margollesii]|uniref:Polysaccharide biosynthesis protein n=1 Tax=Bifidobacterium margollesii TaxID=2020964 RepID=A0A2N5JBQ5_9BIFI|nr:MATE family efflux transporter [Bifidobacterium margollesii]PLS31639.1 polysaccharide biosynthesis protein [Bifidobacterium margollesii]
MRRGLIFSLSSNVVFFLSGYLLHFFLGNSMPAASYGIVGTIITVLDFEYMFLSNGARQSLAKEISMKRFDIVDIVKKTISFQLIIIAFFFAVNFFGAPVFGIVLNDASLDFYFRVAAFLIPANGLFVILLGINDGLQQFGISALLGTLYPIAKLSVIPLILFVFKNDPVVGLEAGFLLALLVSIALGCILLVPCRHKLAERRSTKRIQFAEVASHTLSFSFFFIVVSLVLSVDTLVVKAVVEPASMAGYYTGAVNFGKLAYYLMSAFVTVILPVVSRFVGEGKLDQAMQKAREMVVIAFVFILPMAVIISASSESLLAAFYGSDFRIAGSALTFLSLSNFCMGMTVMLNMVLTSHRSTHFSDLLSIGSLVIVIPVFVLAAKFFGISGIALASLVSTFTLMTISWLRMRHDIGDVMTRRSWMLLVGAAILWLVADVGFSRIHVENIFVLAGIYVIAYAIYVGALVAFRIVPLSGLRKIV